MSRSTTSFKVGVSVSKTNVNREDSTEEGYERVQVVLKKLREEKLNGKNKPSGNNVTFKKSPSDWDRPWRSGSLKGQKSIGQKTSQQKGKQLSRQPSKCAINDDNFCACGQDEDDVVRRLPQNSGATYCADETCGRTRGDLGRSCQNIVFAQPAQPLPAKCAINDDNFCGCCKDEGEFVRKLPQDSGVTYCADGTCVGSCCEESQKNPLGTSREVVASPTVVQNKVDVAVSFHQIARNPPQPQPKILTTYRQDTLVKNKVDVAVSHHQVAQNPPQPQPKILTPYRQGTPTRNPTQIIPFKSTVNVTQTVQRPNSEPTNYKSISPYRKISPDQTVSKFGSYRPRQGSPDQTMSAFGSSNRNRNISPDKTIYRPRQNYSPVAPAHIPPRSNTNLTNLNVNVAIEEVQTQPEIYNRSTSPLNPVKRRKGCSCLKYLAALSAVQQENSSKCCKCKSRQPSCCRGDPCCKCNQNRKTQGQMNNDGCQNVNNNPKSSYCNTKNDDDRDEYPQHNYPPNQSSKGGEKRKSFDNEQTGGDCDCREETKRKSTSFGSKKKSCLKDNQRPIANAEKYRLVASIPNRAKPSNTAGDTEDFKKFSLEGTENCQNIFVDCTGVRKPEKVDDCDCCDCVKDIPPCCDCPQDSKQRPLVIVNNTEVCDCKDKWARVRKWQKEMLCREKALKQQQAQKEDEERYRRRCEKKRAEILRREEEEERRILEKKRRREEKKWRKRQLEAEKDRMEREEARWAADVMARKDENKFFDEHEKLQLERDWRREQLRHHPPAAGGFMACPELEDLRRTLAPVPLDGMNETFEYFCCEPAKPEKKPVECCDKKKNNKTRAGDSNNNCCCPEEELPPMDIERLDQAGQVRMRFPQYCGMPKTCVRLRIPGQDAEGTGGKIINIFTGARCRPQPPPPPPCCPPPCRPCCPSPCLPCCPPPCPPNPNPCSGETIPPQVLNYINRLKQIASPDPNSWLGSVGVNNGMNNHVNIGGFQNYQNPNINGFPMQNQNLIGGGGGFPNFIGSHNNYQGF